MSENLYPQLFQKFAAYLKNRWGVDLVDCRHEVRLIGDKMPYKRGSQFTLVYISPLNGLRQEARFFSIRHAFYALPRFSSKAEFMMYLKPDK